MRNTQKSIRAWKRLLSWRANFWKQVGMQQLAKVISISFPVIIWRFSSKFELVKKAWKKQSLSSAWAMKAKLPSRYIALQKYAEPRSSNSIWFKIYDGSMNKDDLGKRLKLWQKLLPQIWHRVYFCIIRKCIWVAIWAWHFKRNLKINLRIDSFVPWVTEIGITRFYETYLSKQFLSVLVEAF